MVRLLEIPKVGGCHVYLQSEALLLHAITRAAAAVVVATIHSAANQAATLKLRHVAQLTVVRAVRKFVFNFFSRDRLHKLRN